MTRQQQRLRKMWWKENKTALLLLVIVLGLWVLASSLEGNMQRQAAERVCSEQTNQTIPTHQQCIDNQYEALQ